MARAEAKIKDGAAPYLQPGEEVLAAIVARPRGWTQSKRLCRRRRRQALVSSAPLSEVDSIELKRLSFEQAKGQATPA